MAGPKGSRAGREPEGHRPPLQSLRMRRQWPHLLAVFLVAFSVYAHSAPRTVTFEDDGSFTMATHSLGVAHPPGFPAFVLLSHPFTWIPVGSVAFRVHLASASFGAAACSLLWWVTRSLVPVAGLAYAAALGFAFSEVMWSQAIIADVYTLNLLIFWLLFSLGLAYLRSPRRSIATLLGLVGGLGLSNHWPFLVLASPCLILSLWPRRRELLRDAVPISLAAGLGLTPYAWMVLRSHQEPALNFYGPIEGLRQFLYFVARRGYAYEVQAGSGWWDKLQFAGFFARQSLWQYTPVGALLAGSGILLQWRRARTSWNLALLAGFLCGGLALSALIGFDYEFFERLLFRVYPLVPYAIQGLWLALGLWWISQSVAPRLRARAERTAVVVGVALVASLLLLNFPKNDRRGDDLARDYGTTLLESLAPEAILFTHGDADGFPIGYLHLVERIRPDIELYNEKGLAYSNRLFHGRASQQEKSRILRNFVQRSRRPVYFIRRAERPFGTEEFGFYSRLRPPLPSGRQRYTVHPELRALAQRIARGAPEAEGWVRYFSGITLGHWTWLLTHATLDRPEAESSGGYRAELDALSASYYGLHGRLTATMERGGADPARMLEWAERAEAMLDEVVPKQHRARLYAVKGGLLAGSGREQEAAESYRRALELDPVPENQALLGLMRLYARSGRRAEYLDLRQRFFTGRSGPLEIIKLDAQLERSAPGPP